MSNQDQALEKILNRIKKMLNLGHDSGATEAERDTALAMAHKLMKKFNIDAAQVAALDERDEVKEARGMMHFVHGNEAWALRAAQSICRLFMCEFYFQRSRELKNKVYFCVVGTAANASTARMISEFVLAGIRRQAYLSSAMLGLKGTERYAYRRSFFDAASVRICNRIFTMLQEIKKAQEPAAKSSEEQQQHEAEQQALTAAAKALGYDPELDAPMAAGSALVVRGLYETEAEKNKAWLAERFPDLKSRNRRERSTYDARGAQKGAEYGEKVHLGKVVE